MHLQLYTHFDKMFVNFFFIPIIVIVYIFI